MRSVALILLLSPAAGLRAGTHAGPLRDSAVRRSHVRAVDTMMEAAVAAAASAAMQAAQQTEHLEIRAPEASKTYVSLDKSSQSLTVEGLPEVYDAKIIEKYWKSNSGALRARWTQFLGISIPFMTRVASIGLSGGMEGLERESGSLARDARIHMEELGPTYIKLGQMMSVRPDVLPQAAMDELMYLQDNVPRFSDEVAMEILAKELGRDISEVFSFITPEPIAAASLAQVYKATLLSTGESVAVKVQRPGVLETISKDLYVLRRAAEVYQNLMDRIAPKQRTDYTALLNEWAIGFYTELDFANEGRNQMRLRTMLEERQVNGVLVPAVYEEYSTRRLLVSEWVDGTKLSELPPAELRELVSVGQEAFLVQLLQIGVFHADPHPGNLLKLHGPREDGKVLALLDFGLVAQVKQSDRDTMISALIHLANKDYTSLVEDFVELGILPADANRPMIIPLMDKALTPYIQGGGAAKYAEKIVEGSGGFQAMTQDMLTVLNEVPFTIPPYFALLARAIVTLEGIALQGDPGYALILESYPFIARKLLSDDRPAVQRALQEALYGGPGGSGMKGNRIAVLLNSALGIVQRDGLSVDLDSVPTDGVDVKTAMAFLLSGEAESLRALLSREADTAADLVLRQTIRRAVGALDGQAATSTFGLVGGWLPSPLDIPAPFFLPDADGFSRAAFPAFHKTRAVLEAMAPKLTQNEELYLLSLADLATELLGPDAAAIVNGDAASSDTLAVPRLVLDIVERFNSGSSAGSNEQALVGAARSLVGRTRRKASQSGESSSMDGVLTAYDELSAEQRALLDGTLTALNSRTYASMSKRLAKLKSYKP